MYKTSKESRIFREVQDEKNNFSIVFSISFAFADEFYKVKVDFVFGNEHTITYQYAILTDKGEFIEISFKADGSYEDMTVERYTKIGNRYIIQTNIGLTMELERDGNDLVLKKQGSGISRFLIPVFWVCDLGIRNVAPVGRPKKDKKQEG